MTHLITAIGVCDDLQELHSLHEATVRHIDRGLAFVLNRWRRISEAEVSLDARPVEQPQQRRGDR